MKDNKAISDDAPNVYFTKVKVQCETKVVQLGNITDEALLKTNLAENCIPENIGDIDVRVYSIFSSDLKEIKAIEGML